MKNQSGTIKTNLELNRVVMGGSGGYRRFPGGSDHFSWQTDRHTLHHNIYINNIEIIIIIIIIDNIVIPSWTTWGQQRSAMHFSFLDLGRLLFQGNFSSRTWRQSSCHIPSLSRLYGIMKLKVGAVSFKYSSSQISRLFTRVQFQKQNFDAQPGTWPRSYWQYSLVLDGFDQ